MNTPRYQLHITTFTTREAALAYFSKPQSFGCICKNGERSIICENAADVEQWYRRLSLQSEQR